MYIRDGVFFPPGVLGVGKGKDRWGFEASMNMRFFVISVRKHCMLASVFGFPISSLSGLCRAYLTL